MDITSIQSLSVAGILIFVAAGSIFAFAREWIYTKFQVKTLLDQEHQRAEDYKELVGIEQEKNRLLVKQLDTLTVVGETMNRILNSLPRDQEKVI